MANFSEGLKSSIKGMFGGKEVKKETTPEKSEDLSAEHLKITAKNFLALDGMARDLNVASQNIKELVRVMGGKPRDKEDMHMLKERELEEKLQVEVEKEKKLKKPTPVPKEEEKKGGVFDKLKGKAFDKLKKTKVGKKASDLKKQFTESNILKSLKKFISIAAVIGIIFVAFKDTFVEWATGLWEAIKEKFDEWVRDIKKWFEEVVQPIIDNVKEFVTNMITKVGEFITKIGDWFVEKFGQIKDFFEPALDFVKRTFDKFMNIVEEVKSTLRNVAEKVLSVRAIRALVPNFIIDFLTKSLGVKLPEEKKETAAPAPPPAGYDYDQAATDMQGTPAGKREPPAPPAPAPAPAKAPAPTPAPAPEPSVVRTGEGGVLVTERGEAVLTGEQPPPPSPAPPPKPAPVPPPPPAPPAKKEEPTFYTEFGEVISVPTEAPKPSPTKAEKPKEPEAKVPTAAPKPEKLPGAPTGEPLVKKISADQGKKAMLDEMDRQKITDPAIRAAIMAQAAKETGGFMFLSENLGYSAQGLSKNFGRLSGTPMEVLQAAVKGGAAAIGELIYGGSKDSPSYDFGVKNLGNTEPGDGAKFRGRGFFQLTGRANYKRAGALDKPESLLNLDEAAKTAVDFAMRYKGDFSDVTAFTRYVNGGTMGLAERKKYFEQFLNDPSITKPGAAPAGGKAVAAAPAPAAPVAAAPAATGSKPATPSSLTSVASVASNVDLSGLSDELKKRVSAMAAEFKEKTGKKLLITSAYRSNEKQKELWDKKVAELGGNEAAARKMVAEPAAPLGKGKGSAHMQGMAIDINSKGENGINVLAGPRDKSTGWLEKYGLMRNVPNEDWHVQLSGTPPVSDTPANPGVTPTVAGKNGEPVDASSGKKESIGPTPTPPSSSTGTQLASASADVAAGQRQQQKPTTPMIVNAPVTNNKTIQKTEVAAAPQRDSSTTLVARAA